jgi:hypothetical protein
MIDQTRRRERENGSAWIALATVALALALGARAAEMWNVRFSTGDEMWQAWIRITDQLWSATFGIARDSGRVYFLLYIPISAFVTSLKSDLVYNLLNVGTFVFGPIVLALPFRRYVGLAPVLLALLLHATLFAHSIYLPPFAYPVVKYYPLAVLGFAVFALQAWLDHGGVLRLVLFALLVALSLFQYESVTIATVLLLGFAFLAERAAGTTPRGDGRWRLALAVTILLIVLYGAAYLGFRAVFPSVYPGTTLAPWAPHKIAQVLLVFGFGGSALYNLVEPLLLGVHDSHFAATVWHLPLPLPSLLRDLRFGDLAVAAGALVGTIACLWRPVRANASLFWLGTATAVLLFIGANALHALSTQYQFLVDTRQGWVGSRYSLLALAMLISAVVVSLRAVLGPLPAFVLALCAGGALASGAMLAGSDNRIAAEFLRLRSVRFDAFKLAHACPDLVARIEGRTLYAPRLIDPIAGVEDWPPDFWRSWIRYRHGTQVRVVDDRDSVDRFDARLDWQSDATGRLAAVLLAEGHGPTAQVRMALAPAAHGFVSWRDQHWRAQTLPIDPGSDVGTCGQGARLLTLPGEARPDTVQLTMLPQLDRLAPPAVEHVRIGFGAEEADDPRREGWSSREPNGTWTVAPVATAALRLPESGPTGLVLELKGFAYDMAHRPLGFAVRIDGVEIGRSTFGPNSPQRELFRIPEALSRRGGDVTLEIVADELRSPSDDGLGDTRRLGVFVKSIVVRPPRPMDASRIGG